MKKLSFCLLLSTLFIFAYSSDAQTINTKNKPLSNRVANYDIWAQLNPTTKIVNGEMVLNWKNASPDTLNEIHFHLYLNAFKNSLSTFVEESGGSLRGMSMDKSDALAYGYCQVNSITDALKNELITNFSYIHPDDENANDQTVAVLKLSAPLAPDSTITLKIKFESKLPKIFARSGYANNYFLVGQWFPKVGVYEYSGMRGAKTGRWNCHQYHAHSEFYADFGIYNVEITVPTNYVVGATGILLNEKTATNGTKTLSYIAEDVLDFAWTASPDFKAVESEFEDVKITALMQPEHLNQADRYIESLKIAIAYFNQHLGPYPYKHVTIVDPSFQGAGSGGMEYPMFITAGTIWNMPKGLRFPESVTIHEFGHNYFMALLASNEFEEAWMDEGMNTYFETRIMDETYGKHNSYFDFSFYKKGDLDDKISGYNYNNNNNIAPSGQFSWLYKGHGSNDGYGMMSYNKPAVFLTTLERMLGSETNDKVWKTFYERWKFKHPSAQDFIAVVEEIGGGKYKSTYNEDIKNFLHQSIFTTRVCDYKIAGISNNTLEQETGLFDKNGKIEAVNSKDAPKAEFKYFSTVTLQRLGEFTIPVEVKITFANGQEKTSIWDGQARTFQIKFKTDSRIVAAQIDPLHKNVMDVNISNNSYTDSPEKSGIWKLTLKFLFAIQNLFQFFNAFI